MTQFAGWANSLSEQGHYKECHRPVGENRRITKDGARLVVDGPFPETKEVISGVFFIEAKDIEDASRVAQTCPVLNLAEVWRFFRFQIDGATARPPFSPALTIALNSGRSI